MSRLFAPNIRKTNRQILATDGIKGIITHIKIEGHRKESKPVFKLDQFDWPTWACPQLREEAGGRGRLVLMINARAPVEDGREIPNKVGWWK